MNDNLPWDKTLIIVPTYNEIDNIKSLIQKLYELYPRVSILIVEDGSPDGTAGAVKELQREFSSLHMIERQGKQGIATAYITGFKWALERDYQFVFEMDSDFSHPPESVQDMLVAAQTNDLVIGSRYINGISVVNWPFKRLLLSYLAGFYIRFITRIPLLDATGGFKCFTRKALESINLDTVFSKGYVFQLELNYKLWKRGLKIVEVPIIFYERKHGSSKMSGSIIFEALISVIILRYKAMVGSLLK